MTKSEGNDIYTTRKKRRTRGVNCWHPVLLLASVLLVTFTSFQNIQKALHIEEPCGPRSSKGAIKGKGRDNDIPLEIFRGSILRYGVPSNGAFRPCQDHDVKAEKTLSALPKDKLAAAFPSTILSAQQRAASEQQRMQQNERLDTIHHFLFDLNEHPPYVVRKNTTSKEKEFQVERISIPQKVNLANAKVLYERVKENKISKNLRATRTVSQNQTTFDNHTDQFLPFHSKEELVRICNEVVDPESPSFQMRANVQIGSGDESHETSSNSAMFRQFAVNEKGAPKRRPIRILCAVYTHEENHHLIQSLIETWGHRCDGFFAASNVADARLNIIKMPHLYDAVDRYQSVWQKVRSMWIYLYRHHMLSTSSSSDTLDLPYDYYFFCGSDTHVVVENLRLMLETEFAERHGNGEPLFLGQPVPNHGKSSKVPYFLGGGSGYVMNHVAALKLVRDGILLQQYRETLESPAEDMFVSECLYDLFGIIGIPTHDQYGAQRFNGHRLEYFAEVLGAAYAKDNNAALASEQQVGDFESISLTDDEATAAAFADDEDYATVKARKTTFLENMHKLWQSQHGVLKRKTVVEEISPYSVSFHRFRTPVAIKRHHATIYKHSCPPNTNLGKYFAQKLA
jgi:hypothetical protein